MPQEEAKSHRNKGHKADGETSGTSMINEGDGFAYEQASGYPHLGLGGQNRNQTK